MSGVCQIRIQAPENLDDSECCLCDRLGNIAAGRGNCSDNGEGALASFASERHHTACALIELCQSRTQVSGITFFTGHFLQTAGHLTERLGPAGGGVSHQRDGIAHVPEILGDGDAGVDRSFTCRNRHIGCIRNQDRPLHQGESGLGILQFRELIQNVRHLVAALTAADIDDDIRVRPLCELVLHDGLAGSEGSGNRGDAAFRNREERVNNSLAGHQRHLRRELLAVRAAASDGPALHQCQRLFLSTLRDQCSDLIRHGEITLANLRDRSGEQRRDHDLVGDNLRFPHFSEDIAAGHLRARFNGRDKMPDLVAGKGRNFDAALQLVAAGHSHNAVQRSLDSVINAADQAGAELDTHRYARGFHRGAGGKARGFLINLNRSLIIVNLNDFTDQPTLADTDNVKHVRIAHSRRYNKRSGYFLDCPFAHVSCSFMFVRGRVILSRSGLFIEDNIRSDSLLNRLADCQDAFSRIPGDAGDQNDGRFCHRPVPVDLSRNLRGQSFGDIDDRIILLRQRSHHPDRFLCLPFLNTEGIETKGAESVDTVPISHDCYLIHRSL